MKLNALSILFLFTAYTLHSQTFSFTPAGATGTAGPGQSQVNTAYANTNLNSQVTVTNGIQYWTVPATGPYHLKVSGAKGGDGNNANATEGGYGAVMEGDFSFTAGQVLKILVGQQGLTGMDGGGGGGSFVTDNLNNPLCIAGGGGGGFNWASIYTSTICAALTGSAGAPGFNGVTGALMGAGGLAGGGGSVSSSFYPGEGSGGGGFSGNGADGSPSTGGFSFLNGGYGGAAASNTSGIAGVGGFGGGGGADWAYYRGAGGGGGYSGGGGGAQYGCGGGGGSYNTGMNQINTSAINAGDGSILITKLFGVRINQTASINCYGQLTAALTVSTQGGQGPFTYSWMPGGSTSTILTGLGPGTYTCYSTGANSVVFMDSYTIVEPPPLSIATTTIINVACYGANTGSMSMNVTGGTPPYTYSWSANWSPYPFTNSLSAGAVTFTTHDYNGCVATVTNVITQPSGPFTITPISSSSVICSGSPTTLSFTSNGATSYTWLPGSITTASATVAPLATTRYTLNAINANGCTASANKAISVNPLPVLTIISNNTVCSGTSLTLNATGATSYTWSSSANSVSISVSPTTTTTYSVSGTDNNGCIGATNKIIGVIDVPIVAANASSTSVCITNTVNLYGSGASTYSWSGGVLDNVAFTPTATNSYTVTGINSCGTGTAAITITVNANPTITINASTLTLCATNSISLSGSGASTYTWSNGNLNNVPFSPASSAIYTVTGMDLNGCKATNSISITVNPLPNVIAMGGNTTVCLGNQATLSGSGAVTYSWAGGITNASAFIPVASSAYTVTGTDNNGCSSKAVTSLTVLSAPVVTANASSVAICKNSSVTLSGLGASSYTWSSGVINSLAFSPSVTATYTITGINSCGTGTSVITITVNTLPTITASASASSVCSGGAVSLYGSGAVSYSWSGGVTNNSPFIPTTTGSYTVTGTDANGCSNVAVKTITVLSLPVLSINAGSLLICAGSTVNLSSSGANTYTWSPNGGVVSPSVTSTYSVTGTNTLTGCTCTDVAVTITVNPLPVITAGSSSNTICKGHSITLTAAGANSYSWSSGVVNGQSFTPQVTSIYSVVGTNTLTNCSGQATVSIVVNALPTVTASSTRSSVCIGQALQLIGLGADTYSWSNGAVNGVSFSPTIINTYSLSGTNTLTGCSSTNIAAITITVNSLPLVSAVGSAPQVCLGGSVILNGSGANTYTWSGNISNGIAFSPSVTNTYSVAGTNTLTGCTSTNSSVYTVSVINLPVVSIGSDRDTICQGESISLIANGALTYSWSTSENLSAISVSPAVTSAYTVSGTSVAGCRNSANITVNVSECTGIKTLNENFVAVLVFPNPNNGSFTVKASSKQVLYLINELGVIQRIVSLTEENQFQFVVSSLERGIYFLLDSKYKLTKTKIIVTE